MRLAKLYIWVQPQIFYMFYKTTRTTKVTWLLTIKTTRGKINLGNVEEKEKNQIRNMPIAVFFPPAPSKFNCKMSYVTLVTGWVNLGSSFSACLSWQPVRHAIAVFFVLQFHSIHDAIVSSDTFEQEHHISRPQTLMTLQRLIHV